MLKCNVKVCGVINRPATVKQNSDGKSYVVFGVSVDVPATKGETTPLQISVFLDKGETTGLVEGRKIALEGVLNIKGAPERKSTYNLSTNDFTLYPTEPVGITGTTSFRGTVCKDVVTPTAKNGKRYLRFSAYSSDKVKDQFYSVFVRFVYFADTIPAFVIPKAKVEVNGDLRISTFNGNVDINCKVTELKPYVPVENKQ